MMWKPLEAVISDNTLKYVYIYIYTLSEQELDFLREFFQDVLA